MAIDIAPGAAGTKETELNRALWARTNKIVLSRVTALPGSPTDGDIYIVPHAAGAHPDEIAYRSEGAWLYQTPTEGWTAYVLDSNENVQFDGSVWNAVASGIPTGYLDTDGTLAANSDVKIASQKATKTYVDAKVAGLSWKQAVRVATTANGTLASAFENGDTVDGVVLATGDRILIKNQSSASENGIYVVAASGAPARASDADAGAELVNASVYVSEGTTNADTQWTCTTNATITVGSTSLAFAQLTSGSFTTASTTEVLTGTDTSKGVTPDALAALWEKGSDVASSGTISLGEGGYFHITGTTTITDIDWATAKDGRPAWVIFDGVLTLTHNSTTLKLPGGANITTAAGDRACFIQDSSDNVICVAYVKADGTPVVGGGGGTTKPFICFKPIDNEPPASNYASLDTRNSHPVLNFDTTTQEAAIFSDVLPVAYAGAGLTVDVYFAAASATSGTIGWDIAIERIDASSLDIDADSFASAQTITAVTVPGTSGQVLKSSGTFTSGAQMDSLAAGEAFRLRVRRDVANDTATGDAQILRVVVRET